MLPLRPFGTTGHLVSPLTYGAMAIGDGLVDGRSPALLRALDQGVSLIDTARLYGGSEAMIRETLREWRGPRPLIATKVAPRDFTAWRRAVPIAQAYPADGIRESVETSLRELGVDGIDLVQLHQWHHAWTREPVWIETLHRLRQEGKLRWIGISCCDYEHDAALAAVESGLVDSVQTIINRFDLRAADALLPACAATGVAVIARCVLDFGGLSGAMSCDQMDAHPKLRLAPAAEYWHRVQALKREFGDDLLPLALGAVLALPGVTTLTMSMPTTALVDANLAAVAQALSALPDRQILERIHLGHGWLHNLWQDRPA